MCYQIDLTQIPAKKIYPLGEKFEGKNPDGEQIGFTNYYMTVDGAPFFGITGEIHYSRVAEDEWEDTILKAKVGGITIVATYVFWNVHEEVEGTFRWDGCRNLRKFVELCAKHGLYVILRVGPFDHGEMRNGGFPDWIYGKPFEVRSCDPAFYAYVRKLFRAINGQAQGLYYREGGPVIATQIDNEYMHSAAPWEITTGTSNEWVPGGDGGDQYMLDIKKIMQEEGLITPFYTCTAWGGARAPHEEALPLWGGYAYWPWIFYEGKGEHPATPEYIYRDNHNNSVPKTYNFEPRYEPESCPYACCEMMGGMSNYYNYRFQLPFESVDALANIKLGSGCNLLGYYMYRGGSNPKGEKTPYLNEGDTPKISYDYQAVIGQYGQLRPSWYRLKTLHYFCKQFGTQLCSTKTVLPDYMESLEPTDTEHLRYSVRVNGNSGFVFLNNFQDHFTLKDRQNEELLLKLADGDLLMKDIGLANGENAILPFRQDLDGVHLLYATAQPITRMEGEQGPVWFFFTPEGMVPSYHFEKSTLTAVDGCENEQDHGAVVCRPTAGQTSHFTLDTADGHTVTIVTLTRTDSMRFFKFDMNGAEVAFLTDGALLWDGQALTVETHQQTVTLCAYPPRAAAKLSAAGSGIAGMVSTQIDLFHGYTIKLTENMTNPTRLTPKKVGPSRFTLDVPTDSLLGHKRVFLKVDYMGDIGHVFINGDLINDQFANGSTWDVRLDSEAERLQEHPLTIYITPIKDNAHVNIDSPMAARMEKTTGVKADLFLAELHPVNEITISI